MTGRLAHLVSAGDSGEGRGPVRGTGRVPGRGRGRAGAPSGPAFIAGVAQVAALLRSGAAPELAWSRGLGVGVRDGLPDPAALLGGAPEPHQAVAVLAAARLAQEVGAAPAVVLDGIVVSLVRDAQARSERSAALAGPRATASLLAWLPVVGLVLGVAVGADPLAVLLDGAGGSALLLAGVGASMVGRRWTALLLRRAARAGADR